VAVFVFLDRPAATEARATSSRRVSRVLAAQGGREQREGNVRCCRYLYSLKKLCVKTKEKYIYFALQHHLNYWYRYHPYLLSRSSHRRSSHVLTWKREGGTRTRVQRGIEDHVHHGILIYCDKTRTKPLPVRGQFLKQPDLQASAGSPNSPQTALRLSPGSSDSSPNSLNPAPKLHSLTPAFRVYVDFVPKLLNSPEASLPKPLSRQPGRPRVGVCLPEDLRDDFYRFRI
jgi:hypothetical protein